jgi:hypothetical protein
MLSSVTLAHVERLGGKRNFRRRRQIALSAIINFAGL